MMKACRLCKLNKDENEFYFRKDAGRYRYECKACVAQRDREKRASGGSEARDRRLAKCRERYARNRSAVAIFNTEQRKLKMAILDEVKSNPCTDCGQKFEPFIMDLDHVPGRGHKKADVSRMVHGSYTVASLKEEIAKCDVVCSNCHRRRTASRGWTRAHARRQAAMEV
jgi:hypothetical protein